LKEENLNCLKLDGFQIELREEKLNFDLKLGGFGRELREENLNFDLIESVKIWERLKSTRLA